jgi:hypothetical protein
MNNVIYMPLLNEGTECWRPVRADLISGDIYQISAADESNDERWAFPGGARVRCKEHVFSDGKVGLVAYEMVP